MAAASLIVLLQDLGDEHVEELVKPIETNTHFPSTMVLKILTRYNINPPKQLALFAYHLISQLDSHQREHDGTFPEESELVRFADAVHVVLVNKPKNNNTADFVRYDFSHDAAVHCGMVPSKLLSPQDSKAATNQHTLQSNSQDELFDVDVQQTEETGEEFTSSFQKPSASDFKFFDPPSGISFDPAAVASPSASFVFGGSNREEEEERSFVFGEEETANKPVKRRSRRSLTTSTTTPAIPSPFSKNPKFVAAMHLLYQHKKSLVLTCDGFSPLEVLELCKHLRKCDWLEELTVKDKPTDANLLAILKHLPDGLVTLRCEETGMHSDDHVSALSDAISRLTKLKSLYLSGNHLFSTGFVEQLIDLAPHALECIDLSDNEASAYIGDELEGLVYALPSLRELNLSFNELEENTVMYVGEALRGNSGLVVLDLAYNGFRSEDVEYLLERLGTNTTLQRIDLSHNDIGRHGMHAMEEFLRKCGENTALVRVDMEDNRANPYYVDCALDELNAKRSMLILRSAQEIPRIGKQSAMRNIPQELVRLTFDMLREDWDERSDYSSADEDDEDGWGDEDEDFYDDEDYYDEDEDYYDEDDGDDDDEMFFDPNNMQAMMHMMRRFGIMEHEYDDEVCSGCGRIHGYDDEDDYFDGDEDDDDEV